jgi:hypothetical protein
MAFAFASDKDHLKVGKDSRFKAVTGEKELHNTLWGSQVFGSNSAVFTLNMD